MIFSNVKSISIPQGIVEKIVSDVILWAKKTFTNLVPTSIDTDGSIFNDCGYQNRARVRSSGAIGTADYCSATGYIKVKANDIIYLVVTGNASVDFSRSATGNCVHYSNEKFESLGSFTSANAFYGICNSSNSVITKHGKVCSVVVPNDANIRYARISMLGNHSDGRHGENMIVTINEEITL